LPFGLGTGGPTAARPVVSRQRVGELLDLRQVGLAVRGPGDDLERAVEARPEALGEQVVGLARRRGRRVLARVRGAEPQRRARDRQREHDDERADRERHLVVLHVRAQRGQKPSSFGSLGPLSASRRAPSRQHPHADHPEQRRISVIAAVIVSARRSADANATPLRKLTPSTSSPSKRDDHRGAGEQHRPPGRVQRAHARRLRVAARLDRVAVAGDDEQRVVDADAEADQGGERRRERRDVDRVGEQAGQAQAAPERETGR
jgi:hypothetical protein